MNWRDTYYKTGSIEKWLKEIGLKFKKVHIYWTNRRIVLVIDDCSKYAELKNDVVGPLYNIAFDKNGKLNKIGLGFLRKNNVNEKDIIKIKKGDKEFIAISSKQKLALDEVLHSVIEKIYSFAPQSKKMKWEKNQKPSFIRPLRNIVSFYDDKKIDLQYLDVKSSNYFYCPRDYKFEAIQISSAQQYLKSVKAVGIILDETYREGLMNSIIDQYKGRYTYSDNTGYVVKLNTYLSEYPALKFFTLDKKFTQLPIELINKVLEDNQKYIVRYLKDDKKHIEYGVVANKKGDASIVFKGNRSVVNGRLEDALFYWEKDKKVNLKSLRKDLSNIAYHPKLGSYTDKVSRIKILSNKIIKENEIKADSKVLEEIFTLVKNDKATAMVKEFASFEGVIGMHYAKREEYPAKVANTLYEHYLPNSGRGRLPSTQEGLALSLADKLDDILNFSKIGGLPKGSSDPYEIRKQTYNVIELLKNSDLDVDLNAFLKTDGLKEFFNQRIYQIMKESSSMERLVKGIAYSKNGSISQKFNYFKEMLELIKGRELEDKIFDTIKRVYNILEKEKSFKNNIKVELFETKSEKDLYKFSLDFQKKTKKFSDLIELADLLEEFFNQNMVNTDNSKLKDNRKALLYSLKLSLEEILII